MPFTKIKSKIRRTWRNLKIMKRNPLHPKKALFEEKKAIAKKRVEHRMDTVKNKTRGFDWDIMEKAAHLRPEQLEYIRKMVPNFQIIKGMPGSAEGIKIGKKFEFVNTSIKKPQKNLIRFDYYFKRGKSPPIRLRLMIPKKGGAEIRSSVGKIKEVNGKKIFEGVETKKTWRTTCLKLEEAFLEATGLKEKFPGFEGLVDLPEKK